VEAIKDHPALLSVCLANEPANIEEPCSTASQSWREWLQDRHQGIDNYNRAHHTTVRDFGEVPLPNPYDAPRDRALWGDYVRFNQEQHAKWLGALASAVREVSATLPVHVKATTPYLLGVMSKAAVGTDPTLLAGYSDLNGNDGGNAFQFADTDFAQSWQSNEMGHDLQKSMNPAPIFNSENHTIVDREPHAIPAKHVRTALWQAATHGQVATTLWVWERLFDHKSDAWGSILERPDAVEAVGLVNIDLNRAAPELRFLQDAPPDVMILNSVTAQTWDANVSDVTEALYTALSFTGVKIGFITERQLEQGILPTTSVFFIPGNIHLCQQALRSLSAYRGHLVFVGGDRLLSRGDHDEPASVKVLGEVLGNKGDAALWRSLWVQLIPALARWQVVPEVQVRDAQNKVVWGVEWRIARDPAGTWIVNLCNYRHQSVRIHLLRDGRIASGKDVLAGTHLAETTVLGSLETKLVRLE
jgi:hypothetical protein